jgi:hypothetical protein
MAGFLVFYIPIPKQTDLPNIAPSMRQSHMTRGTGLSFPLCLAGNPLIKSTFPDTLTPLLIRHELREHN